MRGLLVTLIVLLAPILPLIGAHMMLTEYYGMYGININQWLSLGEMVGPCIEYFIEIFYAILILTTTSLAILWILELSSGYIARAKSQSQKKKNKRLRIVLIIILFSMMTWGTLGGEATSISSLSTTWIVLVYVVIAIVTFSLIYFIHKVLPDIAKTLDINITLERKIYLLLLFYPIVIFLCYSKIFGVVMSTKTQEAKNYYSVETTETTYDSLIYLGKSQKELFFVRRTESKNDNVTHVIQIEHVRKMENDKFKFH